MRVYGLIKALVHDNDVIEYEGSGRYVDGLLFINNLKGSLL